MLAPLVFLAAAAFADPVQDSAVRLAAEVRASSQAYANLLELTALGPRLGGSAAAETAVDWAARKLGSYGFDKVWTQAVSVPKWERGTVERATALTGARGTPLTVTALGKSVGTPEGGVTAPVVEVRGLDDVARLGDAVRGKIVFYNRPMDAALPDAFEAYSQAADQRFAGASTAAAHGAVAVLVRSMTTLTDDPQPHTGGVSYREGAPKIPAAALSTRDANRLSALLRADPGLRVTLELSARDLGPVWSRNVIAEMKGRELPDEFVVVGGHLDSWDLGPGAHDDAAGVVHAIEALRALKALGIRPKRTVRLVLFMSEEQGGIGGKEYARQAQERGERHVAALESDRGGFAPLGFSASTPTLAAVESWKPYLEAAGAGKLFAGGTGTDTSWLEAQGVPSFELIMESRHYFDYHHAARDRPEAVKPDELRAGAAAVAVWTYLAAELGTSPR
jgi:hypothetical protein